MGKYGAEKIFRPGAAGIQQHMGPLQRPVAAFNRSDLGYGLAFQEDEEGRSFPPGSYALFYPVIDRALRIELRKHHMAMEHRNDPLDTFPLCAQSIQGSRSLPIEQNEQGQLIMLDPVASTEFCRGLG